ncbi:MAG: hypothetical protein L0Z73_16280 [Gammaproteobacteria bacterium]|nr:hypothetical protein [Gammaproteobacteria bacterium]
MDIYIGNIPEDLECTELRKVVNYVLFPHNIRDLIKRIVNKKDKISHSEFDIVVKQSGDQSIRYARAVIQPDSVARRVLLRLDHLTFQGSSLRAREYITRSQLNERRRSQHKNLYAVTVYNRRMEERRKFTV